MNIKRPTGLFFLLTLMALPASACEIWYDKFGRLHGDCRLSDFFDKYELAVEIDGNRPVIRLPMPNLRIRKISYWVHGGTGVEVFVDVENTEPYDVTTNFDIALTVVPVNPLTLGPGGTTQPLAITVNGLPAGARQRHKVGWAYVPDRSQDWDLSVVAVVDPPGNGSPTGQVWESDEQDNVEVDACRVFGQEQTGGSSIQTPACN